MSRSTRAAQRSLAWRWRATPRRSYSTGPPSPGATFSLPSSQHDARAALTCFKRRRKDRGAGPRARSYCAWPLTVRTASARTTDASHCWSRAQPQLPATPSSWLRRGRSRNRHSCAGWPRSNAATLPRRCRRASAKRRPSSRAPSRWPGSPTSSRGAARPTKRCASAAEQLPVYERRETSARERSRWARSPTSSRARRHRRSAPHRPRGTAARLRVAGMSVSGRSRWARSPTSCTGAARPTKRCGSAARSSCRSSSASVMSASGR